MSIIIERTPIHELSDEEVIEGTLAAINTERARHGLEPQPELLGGYRKCPSTCPVSRTLGRGGAAAYDLMADEPIVRLFVYRFDRGGLEQCREEW